MSGEAWRQGPAVEERWQPKKSSIAIMVLVFVLVAAVACGPWLKQKLDQRDLYRNDPGLRAMQAKFNEANNLPHDSYYLFQKFVETNWGSPEQYKRSRFNSGNWSVPLDVEAHGWKLSDSYDDFVPSFLGNSWWEVRDTGEDFPSYVSVEEAAEMAVLFTTANMAYYYEGIFARMLPVCEASYLDRSIAGSAKVDTVTCFHEVPLLNGSNQGVYTMKYGISADPKTRSLIITSIEQVDAAGNPETPIPEMKDFAETALVTWWNAYEFATDGSSSYFES